MTEKIYIVRVKNAYNKQFKNQSPLVTVSFTDDNKERHVIESFADKEKNVGIIAGHLLATLREKMEGDGGGIILIGKN
jgi:hypothetical protein